MPAVDVDVTGMSGTFGVSRSSAVSLTRGLREGVNQGAIVQPMTNFFMEIAQDWPYRQQWIARAGVGGLGGQMHPTFFDSDGGITETVGVNYTDTNVVGRPEQYKQYTGTNNREISVNLHFHAQGSPWGGATSQTLDDWLRQEVQSPVRWLDSLRFPFIEVIGNDRISHAPPPIMLYIGELIAMRCLLTEAPITWKAPFSPQSLLPHGAEVNCTFTAVSQSVGNYQFSGPSRWAL